MSKRLEELPIYPKAVAFTNAVTAILRRDVLGRNRKLHEQIDAANDSILANMSEGFEQPTDKALEKYLFDAKGSTAEVLARLRTARKKAYITPAELTTIEQNWAELLKMLGGWIRYLARCDWKDRGRHWVRQQRNGLPPDEGFDQG